MIQMIPVVIPVSQESINKMGDVSMWEVIAVIFATVIAISLGAFIIPFMFELADMLNDKIKDWRNR